MVGANQTPAFKSVVAIVDDLKEGDALHLGELTRYSCPDPTYLLNKIVLAALEKGIQVFTTEELSLGVTLLSQNKNALALLAARSDAGAKEVAW